MKVVRTRAELAEARAALTGSVALVPTMGALHDGHRALLDAARRDADAVTASIFVNPLQFGPADDLARYPRSLDADVAVCDRAGVDLVWAPDVTDVYPDGGVEVCVDPGALGLELEGRARPGHFAGALTVVAKFFGSVRPDVAHFGEKDYQQLTLIRRMAADLELGVRIEGVPTVREPDGLARSSRNVFLSADERRQALALSRALFAGQVAAADGTSSVLTAATSVLRAEPGLDVDYVKLRAPDLGAMPTRGPARLLVAARVGRTRLIDNVEVQL